MIKVYNRNTKKIEEVKHFGENRLRIIYKSKLLTRIFTSKIISKIYGSYNNLAISKNKINKFIKDNNIDISLYEEKDYRNFNEFFIRKYKNIKFNNGFISPCEAKLLVYKVNDQLSVKVKNITYTLNELFNDDLGYFNNGYLFIFRLSLDNCHRFYYIDEGKRLSKVRIKGSLHTVSSSSNKYKIYKENEREYSVLDTKSFGKIIYMEVGAMLIGKIVNYDKDYFSRGDEKGYFLPGASTIIILANNIKVDKDILENSKNNIETLVSIGERIGDLDV